MIGKRGAWVRIYGVPLHAWNIDFFKLCVLDVGCLLRVDDCTVNRDRFDYARVLLSTTSLDIIHSGAQVLIDGVLFDLQIIEEWGHSLGEDSCLLDNEESVDDTISGTPEEHAEFLGREEVNDLLQHISESWKVDDIDQQVKHSSPKTEEVTTCKEAPILNMVGTGTTCAPSVPVVQQQIFPSLYGASSAPHAQDVSIPVSAPAAPSHRPSGIAGDHRGLSNSQQFLSTAKRIAKCIKSCPPCQGRSLKNGPWSWEWVNKHKNEVSGALPTNHNEQKATSLDRVKQFTRKKGGGYLRNNAQCLKRIARLSDKDRQEVLRALRKSERKQRSVSDVSKAKVISDEGSSLGGSIPVNNDWSNWLVLHGNNKVVNDEVCDIGKMVGLKFKGDKNNMFDVLSGVGRRKSESGGNGV